jgi:hypothetical protein
MKNVLRLVPLIICLFGPLIIFVQSNKPRVAVIPFNPINNSQSDAIILSGLLETVMKGKEIIESEECISNLESTIQFIWMFKRIEM